MTNTPYRTSPARRARSAAIALLALGALGTAACSDSAAPLAPEAGAPSLARVKDVSATTTYVGDTTVTRITIRPNTPTYEIWIGNGNSIEFPKGASSVCDVATSSYGPGTWDSACKGSTQPVTIIARTWTDARGLAHSDFQPAMRFVPSDAVTLEMRNKNGLITNDMRIDFCTPVRCVNEAAADPTVATKLEHRKGTAKRRIKHFSGYMVTVGLTDEGSDMPPPGEIY